MMILTAKVDFKKILLILTVIAVGLLFLILALGREDSTATAALSGNDSRVQFLESFGWEVKPSPKESSQVRIPAESSDVFERYNRQQQDQDCNLLPYAGKKVMRYVYEVTNFPDATDPVYATVLVYKDKIIGGDITNTAPSGKIQGFRQTKPRQTEPEE